MKITSEQMSALRNKLIAAKAAVKRGNKDVADAIALRDEAQTVANAIENYLQAVFYRWSVDDDVDETLLRANHIIP